MAETWTDPEDYWNDGDVATGALMNTYISNNLKFLKEHHDDHINAAKFSDLDSGLTPAQTNVHGATSANAAAIGLVKRSTYTGNSDGSAAQVIDVGFQIVLLYIYCNDDDHSWIANYGTNGSVQHIDAGNHTSTTDVRFDLAGTTFTVGFANPWTEANRQGITYQYVAVGFKSP